MLQIAQLETPEQMLMYRSLQDEFDAWDSKMVHKLGLNLADLYIGLWTKTSLKAEGSK